MPLWVRWAGRGGVGSAGPFWDLTTAWHVRMAAITEGDEELYLSSVVVDSDYVVVDGWVVHPCGERVVAVTPWAVLDKAHIDAAPNLFDYLRETGTIQ